MPLSYLAGNATSGSSQTNTLRLVAADAPVTTDEVRSYLQTEMEHTNQIGIGLCALLGMTSDWANTRWIAGPTNGSLVPTYQVTVQGAIPDEAVTDLVTSRLASNGWKGTLFSREPVLRLDAARGGHLIRLTATGRVVRLLLMAPAIQVEHTLAAWILAGVYEDDDKS